MKRIAFGLIAFAVATISAEGRLGNFPEYPILDKAEVVAIFEPSRTRVTGGNGWSALYEIDSPKFLRGEDKGSLSYVSEETGFTGDAQTCMVFLAKDGKRLAPVNWMCSTIPSSLEAVRLETTGGDCWDVLRAMFLKESNADFALLQARVIATGPPEFQKTCVQPLGEGNERLWLARFVVSLYGEGVAALDPSRGPFPDISQIGVRESGADTLSHCAQASVGAWFHRNASAENASKLLDFALLQKGSLQAEMLIGIAKFVPADRLEDIARLMKESRHNGVRYACFKAVNYRLNQGKGICGADDFRKNPKRYLGRAEALLAAAAVGE